MGPLHVWPLLSWMAVGCVALSVVDLRHRRLPTRMVWALGLGLVVLTVPEARAEPTTVARMVVGVAAAVLPLAVVRCLTSGGVGGGDVRLVVPLGAFVGLRAGSTTAAASGALAGLLVASGLALVVVAARGLAGRGWSEPLAFGPCLCFGLLASPLA